MELNKTTMTEFDYVVCIDASGSMATASRRFAGKTRWQELQETCFGIASEIAKYDSDGIDVVVFGGNVEMHNNVTPDKVQEIFQNRGPRGTTPLAAALKLVVDKQAKTGKNTVCIVFTDGVPDNKMEAATTIINASKNLTADENLTFLFVQIGDDPDAEKYLKVLDDDLRGAKFDIVDALTAEDADKLDPIDLIIRAIGD